jgi:transcriptional regulator GlxA family with amidase domain
MADPGTPRRVGVVLFEGFELLDVFGPLEIFGALPDRFTIVLIGPSEGPVASNQGPRAVCDFGYFDAPTCDIVLVPGGQGTRSLVGDEAFLGWLSSWAEEVEYLTSVCTGAAVLAAAGLLEGRRATTNKAAFRWVESAGAGVEWIPEARWVVDGNRWTSSGVSAGIDMALALVADAVGHESARNVATYTEYEWHDDPSWDPFAAVHGLT